MDEIVIKEVSIEEIIEVNASILEFDRSYGRITFEQRCQGRETLLVVGYINGEAAGYIVGYDRDQDGSFYCWMAGVNPLFRRRGVLTSLMAYEDIWAKKRGYIKLKIKTRNSRREMLSYLVKHDFNFTWVEQKENIEEYRIHLEKQL